MSQRSTCTYFMDLGELGETDAEISFNWYKCKREAPDDYDDLEIEAVHVMISGKRVDVISIVTEQCLQYITDTCWSSIEGDY